MVNEILQVMTNLRSDLVDLVLEMKSNVMKNSKFISKREIFRRSFSIKTKYIPLLPKMEHNSNLENIPKVLKFLEGL